MNTEQLREAAKLYNAAYQNGYIDESAEDAAMKTCTAVLSLVDPTPITEERLLLAGGKYENAKKERLLFWQEDAAIMLWRSKGGVWKLADAMQGDVVLPSPKTMGQFRLLALGLGIDLKEPTP